MQGRIVNSLDGVFKFWIEKSEPEGLWASERGLAIGGGGRCKRYMCIILLDNIYLISFIWVRVREVRKGRSLVDSGTLEAINGEPHCLCSQALFLSTSVLGNEGHMQLWLSLRESRAEYLSSPESMVV